MDSEDDSRHDSSASNSSESSDENNSDNSRPSSPEALKRSRSRSKSRSESPQNGNDRPASPVGSHSSRGGRSGSSKSRSSSSSSGSASSSDDDEVGSGKENNSPRKQASSRSSSEGSDSQRRGRSPRNQSLSPVRRKSRSSGNSSASSDDDDEEENNDDGAINMSHEDLSDASETDSHRRDRGHTKQIVEDEVSNGSMVNISTDANISADNDQISRDLKASPIQNNSNGAHEEEETVDGIDANVGNQQRQVEHLNGQEDKELPLTDLRQKLDQKKANNLKAAEKLDAGNGTDDNSKNDDTITTDIDELVKKHDEDALDFEAEEGECPETSKEEQDMLDSAVKVKIEEKSDGETDDKEELEEGEVSDEDEKRPEETEPKPICRFYTRGQCTWGMNCRFLHPGVTDKGNYTMFDMVRPVPLPAGGRPMGAGFPHDAYHDYRSDRPPLHHRPAAMHLHPAMPYAQHHDPRIVAPLAPPEPPVIVESAWERGLRTAKEMMRKANKRKEQDMDFEDKKMNLTLSPEDVEKDPYYMKDRASPLEVGPYSRHQAYPEPHGLYTPPERFARGPPPMYDDIDPYGRSVRYRELPPHRMPHYEDERRVRPAREVIVQRVEPPVGRGDEWNDPWMRSKSPGGRALSDRERSDKRRRDRRSYSSNSSYSSSSSSQSDSSSESSRSPTPGNRRRYNSGSHKSPPSRRHFRSSGVRSPSPRRPRRSPSIHGSTAPRRRGHSSPSPIPEKRAGYSPASRKRRISPVSKKSLMDKSKRKRRGTSTSASESTDTSGSGSDTSSSSSGSSSQSRGKTPVKRLRTTDKVTNERKAIKKVEAVKKRSPISIEIKKPNIVGQSALTSPSNSNSNSSEKPAVKDMKNTRREELLKQLRAVEDAIAKKRSKLA